MATQQRRPLPPHLGRRSTRNELRLTLPSDPPPTAPTPPTHAQIAQRAYELYEARGRQPGKERQDWFRAERELLLGR